MFHKLASALPENHWPASWFPSPVSFWAAAPRPEFFPVTSTARRCQSSTSQAGRLGEPLLCSRVASLRLSFPEKQRKSRRLGGEGELLRGRAAGREGGREGGAGLRPRPPRGAAPERLGTPAAAGGRGAGE